MKFSSALLSLLALALPRTASALQFRTLAWGEPVSGLYYSSAGRDVPLAADPAALSRPFTLDHTRALQLYRLGADRGHQPAGVIPIPQNLARAILVLHAAPDGTCSGKWIDDSLETAPAGTFRIYNLSARPVALSLGGNAVRPIEPGADLLARFPLDVRAIPVRIAVRIGDTWNPALSLSQPVRPRLRFLVLIRDGHPTFDNPDPLLDWMAFPDSVPPTPASPLPPSSQP